MPFKSKAQLRTCYGRKNRGTWNCKEFLEKTPSVCCLPERKGMPIKTRCMRQGERIVGKVMIGPRGGKYFDIEERDKRGKICVVRVYLPRK
jgi:hypothetical protein